jgi:hypothetical protein
MDPTTGRIAEGIVPSGAIISGRSIDNLLIYCGSGSDRKTFRLALQDNSFPLKDANIRKEADGLLLHISCLQGIDEKRKLAIWEQTKQNAEFPDSRIEGKKLSNSILSTVFVTGSSGVWRDDRLFGLESNEQIDSIGLQEKFAVCNPSHSDFTWGRD